MAAAWSRVYGFFLTGQLPSLSGPVQHGLWLGSFQASLHPSLLSSGKTTALVLSLPCWLALPAACRAEAWTFRRKLQKSFIQAWSRRFKTCFGISASWIHLWSRASRVVVLACRAGHEPNLMTGHTTPCASLRDCRTVFHDANPKTVIKTPGSSFLAPVFYTANSGGGWLYDVLSASCDGVHSLAVTSEPPYRGFPTDTCCSELPISRSRLVRPGAFATCFGLRFLFSGGHSA